jgi:hypothetical protein
VEEKLSSAGNCLGRSKVGYFATQQGGVNSTMVNGRLAGGLRGLIFFRKCKKEI